MNKFYNRVGQNLNRKELEVVSIERDESGEITSLIVDESRFDNEITVEGTVFEANTVNEIIRNMILEELNITDSKRVTSDKNALILPDEAYSDFVLTSKGEKGTLILWEKLSGTGITIVENENIAKVTRTSSDQTATLKATLSFGSEKTTKEFIVKIPYLQTFTPKSYQTTWTRTVGTTKVSTFNVNSSNSNPIYLEATEVSNGLRVDLFLSGTANAMVGICETEAHYSIGGTGSVILTCNIKVYGDSNKQNLLGVIPCSITYYYN